MLRKIRLALRERLARRLGVPAISFGLEHLKARGFNPLLVFDVGAHRGEFAKNCFALWPECQIVAFEALDECVADLQQWSARQPRLEVIQSLLGPEQRDEVALHVKKTASSILSEQVAPDAAVRRYPMRTIDNLVASRSSGTDCPDLIKLDVQGYELEVLKGAERTLRDSDVLILEANLLDLHRGVPLLAEMIAWLDARDWVAYDICGLTRRPLDRALWQADFTFVPRDSELRADKRWSA